MLQHRIRVISLWLIPFLIAAWVWASSLSFVPVPWPDDSAFYFVAHELFKWPPRWVMLPQAPFEPTYRIFNFNTMPFYPLLIGIGRFLGIDGSHALKIYPLGAWAATGALLGVALFRKGLPYLFCILLSLVFILDPAGRWASVVVRPESLIGLVGAALVLGMTFGFPKKYEARGMWDPIAALLAFAAYSHFNAIHLLFPALIGWKYSKQNFKALVRTGALSLLYLSPWLLIVLSKLQLFIHQMTLQWNRLAIGNDWLSSPSKTLSTFFQEMGNPEPWTPGIQWAAFFMVVLLILALTWTFLPSIIRAVFHPRENPLQENSISLLPAAGWIIGAIWLWNSKPEVWFTYYFHPALWTFVGIAALKLTLEAKIVERAVCGLILAGFLICFAKADLLQFLHLNETETWHWKTYQSYIDCIDERLTRLEAELGNPKPFQVWAPTFPDITIELSRRHRDWEFSRTNDFNERRSMAIAHGHEVQAVVVSETFRQSEQTISAPASAHPGQNSVWMTWEGYYLIDFWKERGWKPNRYLCQRGRWEAFLFMNEPSPKKSVSMQPHAIRSTPRS